MPETREERSLTMRAAAAETAHTVTGIGVPWNETISIWGERERFAPGSVDATGAKLFARHKKAIGIVTSSENTADGWVPVAKFSDTRAAKDAYNLARDGVYDSMSVAFKPLSWHNERDEDGSDVTVYDSVQVREVSLVPFPAYPSAKVAKVRSDPTHSKEDTKMPTTTPPVEGVRTEDVTELRESVEDLKRTVTLLGDRTTDHEPVTDERSAGEWLRDLAAGNSDTTRDYEALIERAYSGGTSDDGILTPQYVGDTIRLIESPNILGSLFATGQLPAKGLQLEYGVLTSDSIDVAEQIHEGDDLTTGKQTLDVAHAPIKTYGGYLAFTRQQIERTTNVNILDTSLRRLAMRAGARKAAVLRTLFAEVVAENTKVPERTITVPDMGKWAAWVEGIVDAAEAYQDLGLTLDALVVDKSIFKKLSTITANDGRPMMSIRGAGVNTVGDISAKTLGGDLASVPVVVNLKQGFAGASFINGDAIRQYNSSVVELADENIINLSKYFGLYYYAANAVEIPEAILPVVAKTA